MKGLVCKILIGSRNVYVPVDDATISNNSVTSKTQLCVRDGLIPIRLERVFHFAYLPSSYLATSRSLANLKPTTPTGPTTIDRYIE